MDDKDRLRLERLQSIRLEDGSPVVWDGENPIFNLKNAIWMAQRANLLFRYAEDGREFQYRVAEPAPVLRCKRSEACAVLCNLVLDNYPSKVEEVEVEAEAEAEVEVEAETEVEAEEWKPTPDYAELLEEESEEEENDLSFSPEGEVEVEPEPDAEPEEGLEGEPE